MESFKSTAGSVKPDEEYPTRNVDMILTVIRDTDWRVEIAATGGGDDMQLVALLQEAIAKIVLQ